MTRRVEKYREMNSNELELQQRELSEQIFRLRFQLSSGQAEGLKKLREAKKDLARVKTLMRQAQPSSASRGAAAQSQVESAPAKAKSRVERANNSRFERADKGKG
jgi:large subunit ribosomal protein L29